MKSRLFILITVLLLAAETVTANRYYRTCLKRQCRTDPSSRRCCRIGAKVARKGYDCAVDSIIATQRYQLSLRQKMRSLGSPASNRLFRKVRRCRRYDACLECCCRHHRQFILNTRRFYG